MSIRSSSWHLLKSSVTYGDRDVFMLSDQVHGIRNHELLFGCFAFLQGLSQPNAPSELEIPPYLTQGASWLISFKETLTPESPALYGFINVARVVFEGHFMYLGNKYLFLSLHCCCCQY